MANSSDRKELKASWKPKAEVPSLSLKDVAKHSSRNDLWIVVHGGVYNVTEYSRDHPGGLDALAEVGGTDATSAYEDVGHSEDAREIMQSLLVGHLEGAPKASDTSEDKTPKVQVVRASPNGDGEQKTSSRLLGPRIELAAFAVGTAALVYFVRHTNLTIPSLPRSMDSKHSGSGGSFLQGFLLASATAAVIGVASVRYLSNVVNFDVDFSKLPAHKTASEHVPSSDYPTGVLMPRTYRKFALREKVELSPNGIFRFVFDLPTPTSTLGLPIGQHITIRGDVEEHSVTRSYTPVSNNRDLGRMELVIRIYPDGQLGKYLSALQPGDKVDIRGPKGAMRYRKGMSTHIGMVGGGTGITPLFQIIRAVCEDKTDNTKISLVYANRSEPDIMLRNRLDQFARDVPSKFQVYYVLDQPPASGWQGGVGRVNKQILQERMPAVSDSTKILVCGPPPMVNATKNNLIDLGFKEPGSVSKMSDQIFCF
ncbi:hypothetical protein BAUCODRAFT_97696 [Baudoinia panamericana UAMH 10762]|uniref:Cytochrome-b5 reductase n=1 Tax=Baudoinia panamericana (strain UAMH 10762) TaxID=717646 RepID=M2M4M5_BAUPA|nr:uncharacterized protein BAUCODRAFT_97696 [Baudoinia panamericana UAMH 10762]EMC91551.1 hypothetical protein BAUCODRAFT_97696 [Baudoinia panamericana UAMH 10762]